MKKLISLAIMAVFASAVSAQVKVTSNGNVTMSKDLSVEGVTKVKLVNNEDVPTPPTKMVGTPINHLSELNPLLFRAMGAINEENISETQTESLPPYSGIINPVGVKKDHYGFAVSDVRSKYPELIETDENGKSYINYTELIPIMVQAIKELTLQVEELQNELQESNGSVKMMAPVQTSVSNNALQTECVLYQNTPNPFSERTMIRFSLPEDVKDAYIYVFDMQGMLKRQIKADAVKGYVTIEASEFEAGMYLYSLVVNGKEVATKRMILSK